MCTSAGRCAVPAKHKPSCRPEIMAEVIAGGREGPTEGINRRRLPFLRELHRNVKIRGIAVPLFFGGLDTSANDAQHVTLDKILLLLLIESVPPRVTEPGKVADAYNVPLFRDPPGGKLPRLPVRSVPARSQARFVFSAIRSPCR